MTIDWVGEALREWGYQRRRLDLGGYGAHSEGVTRWHWDGWPARSVQGKSKDEGEGASYTADGQHYAEVLLGDGLKVARALNSAPEKLRDLAYVHYVIPRHVAITKQKISELKYSNARAYYTDLGRLHVWVAARWDVPRETNAA